MAGFQYDEIEQRFLQELRMLGEKEIPDGHRDLTLHRLSAIGMIYANRIISGTVRIRLTPEGEKLVDSGFR